MQKCFSALIFILCGFSSHQIRADNYTPDQQKKINQIQQSVHHDLMIGDVAHARSQLDEAGSNFHSEEIELAAIQTLMQGGEYRHALSAAAHTQAEHRDFSDATLLYAWLLAIGGQLQPAKNLVLSSLERNTSSELTKMLAQLNSGELNSSAFKSTAMQLGPVTDTKSFINNKFLASGILVDAQHVITSRTSLANYKNFTMQNGLGRVFKAHIDETFSDTYLARLILESPPPTSSFKEMVNKTPFPGTPIYIVSFPYNARPNWPQLSIDILGTPIDKPTDKNEKLYSLNSRHLDYGTGVYNLSGQLIGIVVSDGTTIPKLRMLVKDTNEKNLTNTKLSRVPVDQIYETALQRTVQIFDAN
jgi:hypothetical protein